MLLTPLKLFRGKRDGILYGLLPANGSRVRHSARFTRYGRRASAFAAKRLGPSQRLPRRPFHYILFAIRHYSDFAALALAGPPSRELTCERDALKAEARWLTRWPPSFILKLSSRDMGHIAADF